MAGEARIGCREFSPPFKGKLPKMVPVEEVSTKRVDPEPGLSTSLPSFFSIEGKVTLDGSALIENSRSAR